jgi:hypothetical protein
MTQLPRVVLLTFIPRASPVAKAPPSLTRRCFCLNHLRFCPNSRPPFRAEVFLAAPLRSPQHRLRGPCSTDPTVAAASTHGLFGTEPRSLCHRLHDLFGTDSADAAAPNLRPLRHRRLRSCGTCPWSVRQPPHHHCSTDLLSLRQQHCDRGGTDSTVTAAAAPTTQ